MNPIICLVLYHRSQGAKHSELNWTTLRVMYDYAEELVDIPENACG